MFTKKAKLLAVGCSFTRGYGLPNEFENENLWINQLARSIDADIVNKSISGVNNDWIFLETMSEIIKNYYDIVIVGWSAIPRFRFHVGLELYPVFTMLSATFNEDIHINNYETISAKWQKETGDRLRKIQNDHWDILKLVKYVNTLIELQETVKKGKIFFVNSLGPWCKNYFDFKKIILPSDLDLYTQQLLSVDTRDDEEILKLYSMIHGHYQTYGGIREKSLVKFV